MVVLWMEEPVALQRQPRPCDILSAISALAKSHTVDDLAATKSWVLRRIRFSVVTPMNRHSLSGRQPGSLVSGSWGAGTRDNHENMHMCKLNAQLTRRRTKYPCNVRGHVATGTQSRDSYRHALAEYASQGVVHGLGNALNEHGLQEHALRTRRQKRDGASQLQRRRTVVRDHVSALSG